MERPDGRTGWESFSPFAKHGSLSHQTLYQRGKQQRERRASLMQLCSRPLGYLCMNHYCRRIACVRFINAEKL